MDQQHNDNVRRSEIAQIIFLHVGVFCAFLILGVGLFSW